MQIDIDHHHILHRDDFQNRYLSKSKPVIISGGLNWPAFRWTPNYLRNKLSDRVIGINAFKANQQKTYVEALMSSRRNINLHEAIDLICNNQDNNVKYYLLQQSIPEIFPELVEDFGEPTWIENKKTDYMSNIWFGESGNVSPLHFDAVHNFFVQIFGKKKVYLFSFEDTKFLYRHTPKTSTVYNISQISDLHNVDPIKFPDFRQAMPLTAILSPGDVLFIPAGWWHHVETLEIAISLSLWWKAKPSECDPSVLLAFEAVDLYERGCLAELKHNILNFDDFDDSLDVVEEFIQGKHYCLAALWMGDYFNKFLRGLSTSSAISGELTSLKLEQLEFSEIAKFLKQTNTDLEVFLEMFEDWCNMLENAKQWRNQSLDSRSLIIWLHYLRRITKSNGLKSKSMGSSVYDF